MSGILPAIGGGFGAGASGGGILAALGGPVGIGLGLASTLLPGLLGGGTTVGPAAPAYNAGPSNGVAGLQPPQALPPIEAPPPALPITQAMSGLPDYFKAGSTPSTESDESDKESKFGFGDFLGGIDKGLQSPSQMLGLGLLGKYGQNSSLPLPLMGLLAMGLLNKPGQ